MTLSHEFWMHISVFEQTFRDIFRPLFSLNCCSVSTKGEQTFGATTTWPLSINGPKNNDKERQ